MSIYKRLILFLRVRGLISMVVYCSWADFRFLLQSFDWDKLINCEFPIDFDHGYIEIKLVVNEIILDLSMKSLKSINRNILEKIIRTRLCNCKF